jgi:hypothetical protein
MNRVLLDVFAFVGAGWVRPIILAALLGGLWVGLRRAGLDRRKRLITWFGVTVPLLAWFFVVLQLAQAGVFRPGAVAPVPAIPLAVLLPVVLGLPLLIRSRNIAAAIDAVPPSCLIGLQVYRVLGAVFLVRWMAGQLPGEFALPAGAGDVLVGLLALPVAFFVHSRARGSRAAGYALECARDPRSRAHPDNGLPDYAWALSDVRARSPEYGRRDLSARHDPGVRGAAVPDPPRAVAVATASYGAKVSHCIRFCLTGCPGA